MSFAYDVEGYEPLTLEELASARERRVVLAEASFHTGLTQEEIGAAVRQGSIPCYREPGRAPRVRLGDVLDLAEAAF